MDPEPVLVSRPSHPAEASSSLPQQGEKQGLDEEDPYSLSGTSTALFGLAMALAVVGVPLVAVLTERPFGRESLLPTALQSDGSQPALPIPVSRFSQPRR